MSEVEVVGALVNVRTDEGEPGLVQNKIIFLQVIDCHRHTPKILYIITKQTFQQVLCICQQENC
jgi:hypothetical protein